MDIDASRDVVVLSFQSDSACLRACLLNLTTLNNAPAHLATLAQVIEEAQAPLSAFYRHISKGAWPFSSRDHGWPISDCSSEGLKAALALAALPADKVRHEEHTMCPLMKGTAWGASSCRLCSRCSEVSKQADRRTQWL
jgi:hypothetical protein